MWELIILEEHINLFQKFPTTENKNIRLNRVHDSCFRIEPERENKEAGKNKGDREGDRDGEEENKNKKNKKNNSPVKKEPVSNQLSILVFYIRDIV